MNERVQNSQFYVKPQIHSKHRIHLVPGMSVVQKLIPNKDLTQFRLTRWSQGLHITLIVFLKSKINLLSIFPGSFYPKCMPFCSFTARIVVPKRNTSLTRYVGNDICINSRAKRRLAREHSEQMLKAPYSPYSGCSARRHVVPRCGAYFSCSKIYDMG